LVAFFVFFFFTSSFSFSSSSPLLREKEKEQRRQKSAGAVLVRLPPPLLRLRDVVSAADENENENEERRILLLIRERELTKQTSKKNGKIVLEPHNIWLLKPTETLAKNTKKIQKNVPARARYIIRILSAPRNNVVTIQRVSCHPGTPRMLEY
jgi:hypothetical protein